MYFKRKLLSLLVASSVAVTSTSLKIFALDGIEEKIEELSQQVQNLRRDYPEHWKDIAEVIRLLRRCKDSVQSYIDDVNEMFNGVASFKGTSFPRVDDLDGVEKNIENYIRAATEALQDSDEKTKEIYSREIQMLDEMLRLRSQRQAELLHEAEDAFNRLMESLPNKDANEGLMQSSRNVFDRMLQVSGIYDYFLNQSSRTNVEWLNEEHIILSIGSTMEDPTMENIQHLIDIYRRTIKRYKLSIYKHLVFLSNRGNPYAFRALEVIDGKEKSEYTAETVRHEDVREEKECVEEDENHKQIVTMKEVIKPEIVAYNDALDREYHRFYWEEVLKGTCEYSDLKIEDQTLTTPKHLYRKSLVFRKKKYATWHEFGKPKAQEGWKLHVTAQPESATKIARIVVRYVSEMDVEFKICPCLQSLRFLQMDPNQIIQQGKFITIYPKDAEQANEIANLLDRAISEELRNGNLRPCDFCELLGDAKVGNTGAIFTRYGAFVPGSLLVVGDNRYVPIYPHRDEEIKIPKKAPFDLELTFLGMPLDKSSNIVMDWVEGTREIQRPLILNIEMAVRRLVRGNILTSFSGVH